MNITKELAELAGMHTGDGTLYRTNWGLVWEMRGGLDEKEYHTLCIAGEHYLEKFIREVAPKNKKHLNKYRFWKNKGYYLPRSLSLAIAVIF